MGDKHLTICTRCRSRQHSSGWSLSSLSLSLSLEIAHNYHCREDDNDNEDAQRDVGEDVGKVDFSQQLAGTL